MERISVAAGSCWEYPPGEIAVPQGNDHLDLFRAESSTSSTIVKTTFQTKTTSIRIKTTVSSILPSNQISSSFQPPIEKKILQAGIKFTDLSDEDLYLLATGIGVGAGSCILFITLILCMKKIKAKCGQWLFIKRMERLGAERRAKMRGEIALESIPETGNPNQSAIPPAPQDPAPVPPLIEQNEEPTLIEVGEVEIQTGARSKSVTFAIPSQTPAPPPIPLRQFEVLLITTIFCFFPLNLLFIS